MIPNVNEKKNDKLITCEPYLGLYLACHIKGPVAFPMQYAESMIALTVTFFVWPAVTLESQDKPNTNPVVPTLATHE